MSMKFSVFQVSRKGGRAKNEDRMGYCYTRESALFVLADGMGGHPDGEVAAHMAVQTAADVFQQYASPLSQSPAQVLQAALMAAHHRILDHARHRGMTDTPRSTLVAALVQDSQLYWLNCGDSRLYLVRDEALVFRTRDHSYAEQQQATDPLRTLSVNRNVLYTCIGSPSRPIFDMGGPRMLQPGDKLLLCSDGLWDNLEEAEIVAGLASAPVRQSVPDLVTRALERGGARCDNVTVVAVDWEDVGDDEEAVDTVMISRHQMISPLKRELPEPQAEEAPPSDDDAIEQSIAEINQAIRDATLKKD